MAERYGARLSKVKDMGYEVFHTAIRKQLEAALEEDKQQNGKIEILLDVYSEIKMNVKEKQKAIDDFIDCVIAVSDCINSNQWHGEDVMGIFFNEFNRYKKKSDAGQVFTPDHITSFMYRLINVTKEDYVGDFACGSGAFLVKAMSNMIEEAGGVDTKEAKAIRQTHLFGIEFDREIYALACANMLIHKDGKTNLTQLDTREQAACDWIKSKPITKVLMNPPFETKYGCVQIVKNVLDNVPVGTDCAFILPDKKLEKTSKRLVNEILGNHRLMMIVKLPEDLFFGRGVTASVFVFQAWKPQNGKEIFGCYIENDGLETVKNQGRHDVKNLWGEIENYWIDAIEKRNDTKYKTHQWIVPSEHLSYQRMEKTTKVYEKDFFKAALDYEMFRRGIDQKEFSEMLIQKVLYSSRLEKKDGKVSIVLDAEQSYDNSSLRWEKFKIETWFEVVKGKRLTKKEMREGNIDFIGSSSFNNGITHRIGNEANIHPGNLITVAYNGSVGETFYHENEFIASDDVNVLYPKFALNKYIALFICPIIKAAGRPFAFIDKWKKEDMEGAMIPLPVDESGAPDWRYMEDCMKRKEKRARKTMDALLG